MFPVDASIILIIWVLFSLEHTLKELAQYKSKSNEFFLQDMPHLYQILKEGSIK